MTNIRLHRQVQRIRITFVVVDLYRQPLLKALDPKKIIMATVTTLPKDISKLGQEVKLFGKWDTQE